MPARAVCRKLQFGSLGQVRFDLRSRPVFRIVDHVFRRCPRPGQPYTVADVDGRLDQKRRDPVRRLHARDFRFQRNRFCSADVLQQIRHCRVRNVAHEHRSARIGVAFQRAAGRVAQLRRRLLKIIAVQRDVVAHSFQIAVRDRDQTPVLVNPVGTERQT